MLRIERLPLSQKDRLRRRISLRLAKTRIGRRRVILSPSTQIGRRRVIHSPSTQIVQSIDAGATMLDHAIPTYSRLVTAILDHRGAMIPASLWVPTSLRDVIRRA